MIVEQKYCEACGNQFFRPADAHPFLRAKYCDACEKAFKAAEFEQLHNDEFRAQRFAAN